MYDLIGIIWDEDHGVVSLSQNKVIMYCYGSFDGWHFAIPSVKIEDEDFKLLVSPDNDNQYAVYNEANWMNVIRLLTHPEFGLTKRLFNGDEQ